MIRPAYEELDLAVDAILAQPGRVPPASDREFADLLDFTAELAAEMRLVPRRTFKLHLQRELEQAAGQVASFELRVVSPSQGARLVEPVGSASHVETTGGRDLLPTLFGTGYGSYPMRRANLLASVLLHTAALALLLTSSVWLARQQTVVRSHTISYNIIDVNPYALPPALTKAGGGGGGGDRDQLGASKGSPPRFAAEQLAPPAIVIRNSDPKLSVEATVIGPPTLTLPQLGQTGDPLSRLLTPSNGTGSGSGIGSGHGTGVGSGDGSGVGPGSGGGIGGGAYRVGGGVTAPRAIYDPEPEYSDEARKAKYQGSVVLWVVIGADGRPRDVRVYRSLGMGLDEKAAEAVRNWKFDPARKDGVPVPVQVNIEVIFHLY